MHIVYVFIVSVVRFRFVWTHSYTNVLIFSASSEPFRTSCLSVVSFCVDFEVFFSSTEELNSGSVSEEKWVT